MIRRADFPSWSWVGWRYTNEIPLEPLILASRNLRDERGHGIIPRMPDRISLDEHTARVSVELTSGDLVDLTETAFSGIDLETIMPREAKISPRLLIRAVIFPLTLEQDEKENWICVGIRGKPFRQRRSGPIGFRMWLDHAPAAGEESFSRNRIRGLVLGRYKTEIHVLIVRKSDEAWSRIGIGLYYCVQRDVVLDEWRFTAFDRAYRRTMKKFGKRTIWLG